MTLWTNTVLGALLALAPGCVIAAEPTRYVGDGELVVDWTIDGDKNPDECRQSDVASISIIVETWRGSFFGEYEQDCEAFATTIFLPPGEYVASAVLLDSYGHERTTYVDMDPFTIFGDDVLQIPIDFPSRAFY
jgi:hypothetical protein